MEHQSAGCARISRPCCSVRGRSARFQPQGLSRTSVAFERQGRRRGSTRHPGEEPGDRPPYQLQIGAIFCRRRAVRRPSSSGLPAGFSRPVEISGRCSRCCSPAASFGRATGYKYKTPYHFVISAVRASGCSGEQYPPAARHDEPTRHAALRLPDPGRLQEHRGGLAEPRCDGAQDQLCDDTCPRRNCRPPLRSDPAR